MRRFLAAFGFVFAALLTLVPIAGAVGERAGGTLIDSTGKTVGAVELEQGSGGVTIRLRIDDISTIKAGTHGIHFHAVGKCDPADFTTAGAHFNPTSRQHGAKNPQGPHAGDLPNLTLDASTATQGGYAAQLTTSAITLSAGPTSILDADGTALIIHANADDETTDPTGNSGGRVACAVITAQAPAPPATGTGGNLPNLPNTGGGAAATQGTIFGQAGLLAIATLVATGAAFALARRRAA